MGEEKNMCNACYKCIHRGTIPGNAHSRCESPKARDCSIKVTGHSTGIKNGWFFHPYNFGPTWLISCDGFEEAPGGDDE